MAGCAESRQRWPGVVVCLYLLGMTLMFAHLGSPITRPPPTFLLPRLLVMVAVAVLVWRRGGLPSSMRLSTSVVFEVSQHLTSNSTPYFTTVKTELWSPDFLPKSRYTNN